MRILRIASLVALALMGFALAGAASAARFQSTQDYLKRCDTARPDADCGQVFVAANNWVRFNSDVRLCVPDMQTAFGSPEYLAAVNGEIAGAIGWLKQHPEFAGLDYVQSLGQGLIALYACK